MTAVKGYSYQLWALISHKLFDWKWGIVTFRGKAGFESRMCRLMVRGQGKNTKVYANLPYGTRGGEWRQVSETDVLLVYPRLPRK